MTGRDVLNTIIKAFPPLTVAVLLIAAGGIFIIGFSRHGLNFVKYGFKQTALVSSFEKRFDDLGANISGLRTEIDGLRTELGTEIGGLRTELGTEIGGLRTELSMIKVNHFRHLKNFLAELTSILLDKNIINNQDKARLDNK